MTLDDHIDTVRLTAPQRDSLFRRLGDDNVGRAGTSERRLEPRWRHRRHDVRVQIEHPGGTTSRFLILARNLSAHGMGFIHGGFLHNTTTCRVTLQAVDGVSTVIAGRVVNCRHLERSLHEIGVHFDEPIDPSRFLTFEHVDGEVATSRPDLSGQLLHLDRRDVDAGLMAYYLVPTGVQVTRVTTLTHALEHLSGRAFDLVAVDVELGDEDGVHALEQMRRCGYDGPLLVVTAETRPDRLSAATWAGAEHVLAKPYSPAELYALLTRLKREGRAFTGSGLLHSTSGGDEAMTQLLVGFIRGAERTADELERAVVDDSLELARTACLDVKGAAAGCGFAPLSEAAADTLELLNDATGTDDCAAHLRELAGMCRRLAAE